VVGALRPDLLDEAGLSVAPRIVSVPSHDTAAAVAGIPAWTTDFAYVCTGTWALVGVELPEPVITEESREANFTNEIGVDGTIRFLRNVTGFWLLQECVRSWGPVDLDALSRAASRVPALLSIVDVQDPGFAVAGDMPARIVAAADRTGGPAPHNRAEMLRCILDSMALAIRHAVRDAVRLSGRPVSVVHLVGGGAANPLFCQSVADACGLPVVAGPTEAASWGNALSQFQALGLVPPGLAPARELIRHEVSPVRYEPSTVESQWSVADRRVEDARAAA
jgi:rhamnulokinase